MPPGFILFRLPRPNRWQDGCPDNEPWVAAMEEDAIGRDEEDGPYDYLCAGHPLIDAQLDLAAFASGKTPREAVERLLEKMRLDP